MRYFQLDGKNKFINEYEYAIYPYFTIYLFLEYKIINQLAILPVMSFECPEIVINNFLKHRFKRKKVLYSLKE